MTLGTGAWQLSSPFTTLFRSQITVGALLSVTVKVVVQVALFPAVSVAVTVMVCEPGPTRADGDTYGLKSLEQGARQFPLAMAPPMTLRTGAWQLSSALAGCVA